MRRAPAVDTIFPVAIATVFAIVLACRPLSKEPGQRLLQGRSEPDAETVSACELTGQRCTRCHDIERVLNAKVSHPAHWERYIERMRRMNGSGIARHEGPRILRCLVFWSFGRPGLDFLDAPRSAN